jgi:hypothetical protein
MMDRIEALLASGQAHSIFTGTSAVKWHKRFATIRTGMGETIATGWGDTVTDALADALSRIGPPVFDTVSEPQMPPLTTQPVTVTTQPAMPGFTRNRMPGM